MDYMRKEFIALFWMIGTIICFCSMAICIRELSNNHSAFDIQFLRNTFCILILVIIYFSRKNISFTTKQLKYNLYRNFFHFLGQSGWTWGLTVITIKYGLFDRIYYANMGLIYCHNIFEGEYKFSKNNFFNYGFYRNLDYIKSKPKCNK